MTWVPLQESGLAYNQSLVPGVTFSGSVITVSGAAPTLDGLHFYINISVAQKLANELIGWDGRLRMTCTSMSVTSPGIGSPFTYIYLVKAESDSGETGAWLQSTENTEPPYPAFSWGASSVSAFVPNQLVTSPNSSEGFDYAARYFLSCPTGGSISYIVFIEAFVEATGPECFWTDLESVEQEC